MKTRIFLLLAFICVLSATAQVPQLLNYRGLARDPYGIPLPNQDVGVKFIISSEIPIMNILFEEIQTGIPTDNDGYYAVKIGSVETSAFEQIDWGGSPKYLTVSVDDGGGFIAGGNTQLVSVPYALLSDKFMLPYEDMNSSPVSFSITNTETNFGIGLKGVSDSYYGSYGTGVYGSSNNTHGAGVFGDASNQFGQGVRGASYHSSGIGVYATNNSSGKALLSSSNDGGISAYFEGGKVQIVNNPPSPAANLEIHRSTGTAPATLRIRSNNENGRYWQINALNHNSPGSEDFTISNTDGEKLKVKGDGKVIFYGPLMPNNNSGNLGQVLTSGGSGTPYWSNPYSSYFNTFMLDQGTNVSIGTSQTTLNQLSTGPITILAGAKLIAHLSHTKISNANNFAGGNSKVKVNLELWNLNVTPNVILNRAEAFVIIPNGENGSISINHHCYIGTGGTYSILVSAQVVSGDTDVTALGVGPGNTSNGQVTFQLIMP